MSKIMMPNRAECTYLPAVSCILARQELGSGAKLVYSLLVDGCEPSGCCTLSREAMAKELGMNVRALGAAVRELEKAKLIHYVKADGRRPDRYYFLEHKWLKEW